MCIQGGYKTQTVTQIANLLSSHNAGKLSLRALRVYFAALVIVATREAAMRSRARERGKGGITPSYQAKELSKLTTLPLNAVIRELRALERVGLMRFLDCKIVFTETAIEGSQDLMEEMAGGRSHVRPVPLPRTVLRFLAKSQKSSTIKTMLCYCVRGLTIARRGGEITGKGCVKASWIAENMGISLRSVRSARALLIAMGFISADESSTQLKLNRTGAYFTINLDWKCEAKKTSKRVIHRGGSEGALKSPVAEGVPVENSLTSGVQFAPPQGGNSAQFAPPYKYKKTSSKEESNNQKTSGAAPRPTGVFKKNKKGRGKSSLFDVKREDLFSFGRVEALYFEACELKLVNPCESSALNVLSAAVRARNAKTGDPTRIFAGLIRRKLWNHITQGEEDQARKALMKFREEKVGRFRFDEYKRAA